MPLPVSDQAERLGRAIKTLLTASGHSRGEVSDVTGFSVPYLSEIIRGTKEAPLRTLQEIARCMGLSLADLYGFAEALPAPDWNPDLRDWAMRTTPRKVVDAASPEAQPGEVPAGYSYIGQTSIGIALYSHLFCGSVVSRLGISEHRNFHGLLDETGA